MAAKYLWVFIQEAGNGGGARAQNTFALYAFRILNRVNILLIQNILMQVQGTLRL